MRKKVNTQYSQTHGTASSTRCRRVDSPPVSVASTCLRPEPSQSDRPPKVKQPSPPRRRPKFVVAQLAEAAVVLAGVLP